MATQPIAKQSNKPRIFHSTLFTEVYAYPSVGGHVRKKVSRVELDWLNMTTSTLTRGTPIASTQLHASSNPEIENAFSLRLLQIGGHWWPSQGFFKRHSSANIPYGHHYPPDLDIGYTSAGGVLVLKTWAENWQYWKELPGAPLEKPDTWHRLSLCSTTEERCSVLRDFGGVECKSVEECPDVPKAFEEGIAQGRKHEELLRKMEDDAYEVEWLNSL